MAGLGLAPSATASPPFNDNFADASPIGALPFVDSGSLSGLTTEPGEPAACYSLTNTAWYSFTPASSGTVSVSVAASDFSVGFVAYEATGPGFAGLSSIACNWFGGSSSVAVNAGTTYYIQVGDAFGGSGLMNLSVEELAAPSNDDFAAATPIGALPFSGTVDLSGATVEPGEPSPSGTPVVASAWYSYTAVTDATVVVPFFGNCCAQLGVYTGNSVPSLALIASGDWWTTAHFMAQAGTTYYLQFATSDPSGSSPTSFTVEEAPPIELMILLSTDQPSTFSALHFSAIVFDPAWIGVASYHWTFGDGGTAEGCCPVHVYATDGDYVATVTATTFDGRSATAERAVSVRTNDVSIERFQVPSSARAGQHRNISVNVKGGNYPTTVVVDLYRSAPGGWFEFVGSSTKSVAPAKGGKTTGFDFNYLFTQEDAGIGKVTFQAVAWIVGADDAHPADNQAISSPTTVRN